MVKYHVTFKFLLVMSTIVIADAKSETAIFNLPFNILDLIKTETYKQPTEKLGQLQLTPNDSASATNYSSFTSDASDTKTKTKEGHIHTELHKQLDTSSLDILRKFLKLFVKFQETLDEFLDLVTKLPNQFLTVLEVLRQFEVPMPSDLSQQCIRHIRLLYTELLDTFIEQRPVMEQWPIQMLDSIFKPPAGITKGTLVWTGSSTLCVDIAVRERQTDNSGEPDFVGEHCFLHADVSKLALSARCRARHLSIHCINSATIQFLSGLPFNVTLAMCFPSSCNLVDKQKLISYVTSPLSVNVTVEEGMCHKKKTPPMDKTAMIISIVMFIPVALALAATLHELCSSRFRNNEVTSKDENGDTFGNRFVSAFSLTKNWKRLFSKPKESSDNFSFIQGIRCLTISWVIYGHVHNEPLYTDGPYNELMNLEKEIFENVHITPILVGALFSVDTFFFVGGFCAVYFFLVWSKDNTLSIKEMIMFYPKRYFRLTPSFAFIVAFIAGPWMYMGNGPFWFLVTTQAKNCRSIWWRDMLYISNYGTDVHNDYCTDQTWYVMVDMQIYLITPPLLMLLTRKPKCAVLAMVVLYLISAATSGYQQYLYNIVEEYFMRFDLKNLMKFNGIHEGQLYTSALIRSAVYFLGMLFGYLLHIIVKNGIRFKPVFVATGWTISIAITTAIIYFPFPFNAGYYQAPYVLSFLWMLLARPLWCLSLAWIIFACSTGHGGMATRFLSYQPFVVIGRLSYAIYLTHQTVIDTLSGVAKSTEMRSAINGITDSISAMALTVAVSIALNLLIEAPISSIKFTKSNRATSLLQNCHRNDGKRDDHKKKSINKDEEEIKSLLNTKYYKVRR